MRIDIKGVIVPTITPFNQNGGIDHGALKWLVEFLIEGGVHGLFPGGTTGEGPLMTTEERFSLAESVIEIVNHRIPVIVHAGAITTQETIHLAQHAERVGADAVAILPPYFYPYSPEALLAHYEAVLKTVPQFPVFIYNNPFILCNSISLPVLEDLASRYSNIVGIKDSSGKVDELIAMGKLRGGKFLTFNGNDEFVFDALSQGVDGCVAGNANAAPELFVALYDAIQKNDFLEAREMHRQIDEVRSILRNGSIPLFKHVLEIRGFQGSTTRAPLDYLPEKVIEECKNAFEAFLSKL